MRLCYDWGAEDLDTVMAHPARYGHIRIVILCHRWGATNIEWAALCGEEGGTKKWCKCVTSAPILTQIDRANVRQCEVNLGVQMCANVKSILGCKCASLGTMLRCKCVSLGSILRSNLGCKCAANFGVHAYVVTGSLYKNRPASITTAPT